MGPLCRYSVRIDIDELLARVQRLNPELLQARPAVGETILVRWSNTASTSTSSSTTEAEQQRQWCDETQNQPAKDWSGNDGATAAGTLDHTTTVDVRVRFHIIGNARI